GIRFFFSSRRRHTRFSRDWSSDVCSSDLANIAVAPVIENCVFQNNGTSIVNKPQINLGPSGADTTFIRNNIIEGGAENVESGGEIGRASCRGRVKMWAGAGQRIKMSR